MNDLFQCTCPNAFEEFWQAYPRKIGKGQARKAYAKALKAARHDDIMFGLSQQLPSMEAKEKQFIPHASTWLNGERWDDEPEEPTSSPRAINGSSGDATSNAIDVAGTARRSQVKDCF